MSVVLLGPQRHNPTIGRVLADKGWGGPYALITAGWQEREPEDAELRAAIGGESVNLELNAHYNALMAEDPELGVQTRHRQTRLRELQEVYRVRLASGMQAARRLLARDGEPWLMDRRGDEAA